MTGTRFGTDSWRAFVDELHSRYSSGVQIETLKIFCDLVETRSFSQAAERNFVTQSAVSQQVRGLEAKFKRRLLERVREV